jgi:hypothetical protein
MVMDAFSGKEQKLGDGFHGRAPIFLPATIWLKNTAPK